MPSKFISILVFSTFIVLNTFSQGVTNLFMGGYSNWAQQLPFGGNKVNFYSGQPVIGQEFRAIDYKFTGTNISDSLGNLLFATNGVIVLNNVNDTMVNGTGLNPSAYTTSFNEGLRLWQGNIIIPHPDSADLYFLFHGTIRGGGGSDFYARYLFYSKIDMSLNGGNGEVVLKNKILINQVLFPDSLSPVGITACKHGNGRDWWILSKNRFGSKFHFFLLTPTGPYYHHSQVIGYREGYGQYCFSPDGTRYGSYGTTEDFEVFDFDRCSGMLSNFRHVVINDNMQATGASFSPNSKYLYGSSGIYLYQIDASSNQPDTTLVTVATWDGTFIPNSPWATHFWFQQLADDGKIYVATGASTMAMHSIEQPDLADTLCDVQQHSVLLPTFNLNIPNFPNYNLGPLIGSPCDTLVGIHEIFDKPINLTISPNPNNGQFEVNYELPQNEQGVLEIINILGEVVYKHQLVQWSSVHRLNLDVSSGIYQVMVTTSKTRESKKIIIQ
jgi:Secretion system C-terminal sorting domain